MWFPIKLPKVMLQALDKQIVAAAAEGIFINKNKLIFVYVPWDILKKKKRYVKKIVIKIVGLRSYKAIFKLCKGTYRKIIKTF